MVIAQKLHAENLFEQVQSLPPLPSAVSKLYELAGDPLVSSRDMEHVITHDQVLTARILKYANSAYYGLSHRISTVSHAIMIIGFDGIRSLTLGFTVFGMKGSHQTDHLFNREGFWRHSLATASAARLLAIHLDLPNPEELFVAGLMHDIGRIVLIEHLKERYFDILNESIERDIPLYILEREYLGMDHTHVARLLCQHWKLPLSLTEIIANHHECAHGEFYVPMEEDEPPINDALLRQWETASRVVALAESLVKLSEIGCGVDPLVSTNPINFFTNRELPMQQLMQIIYSLPDDINTVESFFNLNVSMFGHMHGLLDQTRHVALVLEQEKTYSFISILLQSMGCHIIPIETMLSQHDSSVCIISDDSMSPQLKSDLRATGDKVIDITAWIKRHSMAYYDALPILSLRQHLLGELTDFFDEQEMNA